MSIFDCFLRRWPVPLRRRTPRLAAVLLLAALLASGTARAQGSQPFSRVALYGGGSTAVGASRLGDFYRGGPGLNAAATTPFYAGVAGLDLGLRRYEARAGQAREDFWAVPVALRWGVRPRLAPRLHVEASALLGGFLMRFSGGGPGLRSESELLMGLDAGLALRVAGRWQLTAGVRYEHVFTSTSVRLWHARAGVRRTFDAPRWLQTLLR